MNAHEKADQEIDKLGNGNPPDGGAPLGPSCRLVALWIRWDFMKRFLEE